MNDFDFDVLQKKRIARSAYHRKNGSKSKRCTLPSDYLTAAEKRKLNGEVKTVELDKPRTMEEFNALTDAEKLLYLDYLKAKYHPSLRMLGLMLGCSAQKIELIAVSLGFDTGYKRGMRPNKELNAAWLAFCGCGASIPVDEAKKSEEKHTKIETQEETQEYNCESASVWVYATPQEVAQLLLMLSGDRRRKFHISFSEVEE